MAQKDDATLLTQAGVIKAETTANANTATRVGTMMEDIIDSKMNNDDLIDEDDMSTNSATRPPSQQSVKAYVDAEVAGAGGGAVDSVNGATGVVVLDAGDIAFTPAGNIAATDVQAAIEELDSEKASLTSASTSTAAGTITLDMSSQSMKMFVGSASFATPKTIAMSNTTGSLLFNLFINVTDVAAVITVPADWFMADIQFDGTAWTPPETGRYELGGSFDGTNWWIKIQGPFS